MIERGREREKTNDHCSQQRSEIVEDFEIIPTDDNDEEGGIPTWVFILGSILAIVVLFFNRYCLLPLLLDYLC